LNRVEIIRFVDNWNISKTWVIKANHYVTADRGKFNRKFPYERLGPMAKMYEGIRNDKWKENPSEND
jgi:hypothetical protein